MSNCSIITPGFAKRRVLGLRRSLYENQKSRTENWILLKANYQILSIVAVSTVAIASLVAVVTFRNFLFLEPQQESPIRPNDSVTNQTSAPAGAQLDFLRFFAASSVFDLARDAKTDLGVYPEPPAPPLPQAGGKIIDPVFGATIMRITDERDGEHLGTYYSYWPTFNKDNSRLLVRSGPRAFIRKFDPVAFSIGPKEEISSISGVGDPMFEGATWSGRDPNILFITANASLYAYHADTRRYELLADIQTLIPGEYIKQPSWSLDGNRVGFSRKRYADSAEPGYAVYDRSTKKLLLKQAEDIDEVTISQSGKYIVAKREAQGKGVVEQVVTNLETGVQTSVIDDADASAGHGDAAQNIYVGYDNFANRIVLHDLANPKKFRTLFQFDAWGLGVGHTSMRAMDESWVLQSFYGGTKRTPFRNEVIQISTDGSQRVRRLFHHQSVYRTYYDSPLANISIDGRFVAFTSNWGGKARTDLFVAKIEVAPTLIAPTRPRRISQ